MNVIDESQKQTEYAVTTSNVTVEDGQVHLTVADVERKLQFVGTETRTAEERMACEAAERYAHNYFKTDALRYLKAGADGIIEADPFRLRAEKGGLHLIQVDTSDFAAANPGQPSIAYLTVRYGTVTSIFDAMRRGWYTVVGTVAPEPVVDTDAA